MERRWDALASAEEGSLEVSRVCLLKEHGKHVTDQASRLQHPRPFLAIKKWGVRHSRLEEFQQQILMTAAYLFLGIEFFLGVGKVEKAECWSHPWVADRFTPLQDLWCETVQHLLFLARC